MKKYRKGLTRRIAAFLMAVIMMWTTVDITAFAAEETGTVLCEHHTEHTSDCGYTEETAGADCTHVHSDECGYTVSGNGVCTHEHDENCGYVEAAEGSSCTYTCSECSQTDDEKEIQAEKSEEETLECTCGTDDDTIHATDCPAYEAPENPECTCVEKCTEDNINVWCDICGVQGIEACEGEGEATLYADDVISSGNCGADGSNTATYTIYDTDGDNVGDKLVISGTGSTKSLGWDKNILDENASTVTTVGSEEGITSIGARLLANLTSMTTLHIPNSLTAIWQAGVSGCTSLTDIVFSDAPALSTLGVSAFSSCTSLKDDDLLQLSSLTTLGSSALNNTAYDPVILPPSVTSVDSGAVNSADRILYVPQSVIDASKVSDWYCGIVIGYELDIASNTATITSMYGRYSSKFTDGITLPTLFGCTVTSVTQRLDNVPILCTNHNMENRTCKICGYTTMCGDNCWWEYEDGVLYIKGSGAMYDYLYSTDSDQYPEWLKQYKDEITEVHFAEGITRIGTSILYAATNLNKIVFEGSQITEIGQNAFAYCTALTDVPLEKLTSLEVIKEAAFYGCGLRDITLSADSFTVKPFNYCTNIRAAFNEDLLIGEGFDYSMMLYKTENGEKIVTYPLADMLEIPDIEYFEGEGVRIQPQDVLKIKDEYAESYPFDGYTYGVDVDFTKFTYSMDEEITGAGDYTLKVSYEYYINRWN